MKLRSPYLDDNAMGRIINACGKLSKRQKASVVRGMGDVDLVVQRNRQRATRITAKALTARMEAITNASARLLEALGSGPGGDTDAMPRQMYNALTRMAESYGEATGGYYANPPTEFAFGELIVKDYQGAAQFQDSVKGIALLAIWARNVAALHAALPRTRHQIDSVPVIVECCRIWHGSLRRSIKLGDKPLLAFCEEVLRAFNVRFQSSMAIQKIIERHRRQLFSA
jgi:hypothetical protein